ncbi:MAG: hypothetical protein M8467_16540 [Anaerolineae bacterium]|nr:hypothetical protein [Anaerolineae bacterium]
MNNGKPAARASQEVFDAARRRAFVQDVLSQISGRSDALLSFQDVQEHLNLSQPDKAAHLEEIPLNKIVGSVGRYRDFNRAFLPRGHVDPQRWMRVHRLQSKAQMAPIDVFRVGEVYFVQDGNHRVSVARARGQKTIQAWVVDVPVRVPLGPDTSPDDLILKSGYAEFLAKTALDQNHPEQSIELTRAGSYRKLLQHIEVHQFYMGLRSRHYPSLPEAASDWYERVYLPVVEGIRASDILRHFPGRTEADLYLWITENRARLQMGYATSPPTQAAVEDFAQENRASRLGRWLRRLLHRLFPKRLDQPPGQRPTGSG